MKKIVAGLVLAVAVATAAEGREWYEGGTLHRGTIADWNAASDRNRLATSADFAVRSTHVQRRFQRLGMAAFRSDTQSLMTCIDTAAADPDFRQYRIVQLAAACLVITGLSG